MSDDAPDWAKGDATTTTMAEAPDWASEGSAAAPAKPAGRGLWQAIKDYPAHVLEGITSLPQRAIEGAAQYQPGSGEIPDATIGPAVETALTTVGTGSKFMPPKAPAVPPPTPPVQPPPLPPEVSAIPRQIQRPDIGVDLLHHEVPHELPGESSRALSAAGTGGPLSGVSPETIAHMRAVMQEQGFTPHTIDQRLEEMSAHHFFGEITPSLEADMGALAAPPGPGKLEVMNSIRQRALEAPQRVRSAFDRAFGGNENVAQLRQIMEGDRAQASAPFYETFRNTVIPPTPQIESLMPRLRASGALRAANQALEVEGQPATHGFLDEGVSAANAFDEGTNVTRVPTATAFQYAKEFLDSRIEQALAAPGGANEARRFTQLKNDLIHAIDNHPDPNVAGIWQQARTTYARPTEILDAVRVGQRVLTQNIHADDLPFLTATYTPEQMNAMRIGMRSTLENVLNKRDTLTAEVINKVLSPGNIDKIRWAIGDEQAERLVSAIEHERHMHTASTRVYGGSPTGMRIEAQKRWTPQPGSLSNVSASDVAGAVTSPVKTGVKIAEHFGLSARRAKKEAQFARLREESSRLMTLQGPERDAVARWLVNGGNPPQRARGGAVHNHNPTEPQKKAGNYSKTHRFFQGLDITLENLKGHSRFGIGKDGKKWSVRMPAHYGYLKRTEGADGDHLDVYLLPNEKSDQVFVIDQKDYETGRFDEHKIILGASSEKEAKKTYLSGFSDGKNRIKHMRRMTMSEFKEWIRNGDTTKQIRDEALKRAISASKLHNGHAT